MYLVNKSQGCILQPVWPLVAAVKRSGLQPAKLVSFLIAPAACAIQCQCHCVRRYVIFVREQQQMARLQQQTGGGTESALDLVGYVEFQHSYRCAPQHLNALQ